MTDHSREITLYRDRSKTLQDAGMTIGACALGIGLICAVVYNSRQPETAAPAAPEQSALVERAAPVLGPVRIIGTNPGSANPRPAIDQSPVFETADTVMPALPPAATPAVKPMPKPMPSPRLAANGRMDAKAKPPADVMRFDRCSPQCETGDPLIVGAPAPSFPMTEVARVERIDDSAGFTFSPMDGARFILNQTATAPRTALRKGREVIGRIVGYDE